MRALTLLLGIPVLLAGTQSAPTLDQIKAELPDGWTRRKMLDDTVLLLLAPGQEAGWQANVFIQLGKDAGGRTLEQMVDDLLPNMKKRKPGFELKSRQIINHASGRKAIVIEYTHNQRGVALHDRELIMPLGDKLVLFATASGAQALWEKHVPLFERILGSIDIETAKPAE